MSDLYFQSSSRLFRPPIEIRRAIYIHLINVAGVHIVCTQQGRLQLAACVGPDRYAGYTGEERGGYETKPLWGARLMSSWGPHWECEEIARSGGKGDEDPKSQVQATWRDNGTMLRVCKRISTEMMEMMTELLCFTITDLSTLDLLLRILSTAPSAPFSSVPFSLKNSLLSHVRNLEITLRLPLSFFKALDSSEANEDELTTLRFEDDLAIWSSLSFRIGQLKGLCSLHIWLDHTEDVSWSFVNERAILSQFEMLVSSPHLDLFFDLPKLHPKLEDLERHYIADENTIPRPLMTLSPLKIHRILRQRHIAKKTARGGYLIFYAQDFPESLGHSMTFSMSATEREHWERAMWVAGRDVRSLLSAGVFVTYSR